MVKHKLVIVTFLVAVVLVALNSFLISRNMYGKPSRAWTEMMHIAGLIYAYEQEYEVIPSGDATVVARVLGAVNTDNQNPRKLLFAPIDRLHFDKQGTWVDDWGKPILLLRKDSTNLVLRSYGKNHRDDGGTNDDISVPVIWDDGRIK
jgi:hypothetical protein